jgi:hypothetical protein
MGGKCIKDIKQVNYSSALGEVNKKGAQDVKISKNVSNVSSKISAKTEDAKLKYTSPTKTNKKIVENKAKSNVTSMSGGSPKKVPSTLREEKINIDIEPKNFKAEEKVRSSIARPNNKKNVPVNLADALTSNEKDVLKVIKKHNKEYEDAKIIDALLTKHFFMRVLDKQSR